MTTASLRATAILAFVSVLRFAIRTPQALIDVHWHDRVSITCAAVNSAVRVNASPDRLMWPRTRREAEVSANVARSSEPGRIVDCRLEGQCRHRPHTGDGHEAAAQLVIGRHPQQFPVRHRQPRHHRSPALQQGADAKAKLRVAVNEIADASVEAAGADPSRLQPKGPQLPSVFRA